MRRHAVTTAELARLYFEEGLPVATIGKKFGMHAVLVWNRLKRAGYTLRSKAGGHAFAVPIADIVRMYFEENLSTIEIAEKTGKSAETIARHLRYAGHKLREPMEARGLRIWRMSNAERRATFSGTHRMEKHAVSKEKRANTRKKIPNNETALLALLSARGVTELIEQKAIGIYNVDFATGPIAIEIVGARRKGSSRSGVTCSAERIYAILQAGFNLIEVIHREPIDPLQEGAADEIVAFIERAKTFPPSIRQYRMIGGAGQMLAVFKLDMNDLA